MNTPNPLLPQGSALEQKSKSKPNLPMIVFVLVAIHVVIFGGMLMSGCKRDAAKDSAAATNTPPSLPPMATDTAPAPGPTPTAVASIPTPQVAPPAPVQTPVAPIADPVMPKATTPVVTEVAGNSKEYTVVKGDSFYTIAKKQGVSITALQNANAGVDPKKLQVGKKLTIPTAEAKATASATATVASADAGSADLYVVKSGDVLGAIAKSHGTSVKAIQEANGLSTTRIKVGQKLKLPAGSSKPAMTETASAAPVPTVVAATAVTK